jgi:formimidoylglutamate deiminase
MTTFFAKTLFDGKKWQENCRFSVDGNGVIKSFEAGAVKQKDDQELIGYVLPSLPNVHSHAFQRAMAGRTERITSAEADSFWTWRKVMYDLAQSYTPDDVYKIAVLLYKEMIAAGYNWVGEFHYLHHQPDGTPYDNPFEMSDALMSAAKDVGIGLTILPALYSYAGFGELAPDERQKRFILDVEACAKMIDYCCTRTVENNRLQVGLCFHSLRATCVEQRNELLKAYPNLPVHIHVAEQMKEVEDSIAYSGKRPVEYLFDHHDVNKRWTLIHATHLTDQERQMIAKSGAIAGLCPTTEANLGDGLFPLQNYLAENGALAIGSDSHVSIDVVEELRWLEYGQRLFHQKRSISANAQNPSPAQRLYSACLSGGAQSMNAPIGALSEGKNADFIVLDQKAPCFQFARSLEDILDSYIFARQSSGQKTIKELVNMCF